MKLITCMCYNPLVQAVLQYCPVMLEQIFSLASIFNRMRTSFYLIHFAASCAILYPFALLLILPYGEDRRRICPLWTFLLYAAPGVLSIVYPLLAFEGRDDLYLNLALLALILSFFLLIRDRFTGKCATLLIALFPLKAQTVLILGYEAVGDILSGAEPTYGLAMNQSSVLLSFLTEAMLFPLIAHFERCTLKPFLRIVPRRVMWLEILLLSIADLIFTFFAFFFVGTFISVLAEPKGLPAWGVIPGLILFVFALWALYEFSFRTALVHAQEAENRLQTALLRETSASLQREVEHSHEVNHDLRQLLRQLNTMRELSGFSDIKPYVEKIVSLTEHIDTVFCQNKCLNGLLQYYAGSVEEKGIEIQISAILKEVSIEDADLTLLSANALENAIRGAEEFQSQTGKKGEITAIFGIIKNRLLIQITNSCQSVKYSPRTEEKDRAAFLPAEAFLSMHEGGGLGLLRMEAIAEKYQGTAQFQFDQEKRLWTTRIALPVREKDS